MKIKLAVLFGGKSVEHEISIISAIQAMRSLNREKYDVVPVYITKNNEMYTGEFIDKIEEYSNLKALLKKSRRVTFAVEDGRTKLVKCSAKLFENKVVSEIDLAFPIVHGTNCEDGTLHGYLKIMNLPLVGCDLTASALGMDKYYMKTVFKDNGIPVLDCLRFTSVDYDNFKLLDFDTETVKNNNYLKTIYEEKLESAFSEKFNDTSVRVELTDEYKIKNVYCDDKKTYDAIMRYLNETN